MVCRGRVGVRNARSQSARAPAATIPGELTGCHSEPLASARVCGVLPDVLSVLLRHGLQVLGAGHTRTTGDRELQRPAGQTIPEELLADLSAEHLGQER